MGVLVCGILMRCAVAIMLVMINMGHECCGLVALKTVLCNEELEQAGKNGAALAKKLKEACGDWNTMLRKERQWMEENCTSADGEVAWERAEVDALVDEMNEADATTGKGRIGAGRDEFPFQWAFILLLKKVSGG
ncbi:MAG TPA: hypothetical protein VEF04_05050 [Blastocatellia bacterium]|nr:hypothetical protein [Blastocatellia bacterium]